MKRIPYKIPYQTEAINKCVAELNESGRAQCRMAPGSGKTVVSLLIKEKLKPKITIFVTVHGFETYLRACSQVSHLVHRNIVF